MALITILLLLGLCVAGLLLYKYFEVLSDIVHEWECHDRWYIFFLKVTALVAVHAVALEAMLAGVGLLYLHCTGKL